MTFIQILSTSAIIIQKAHVAEVLSKDTELREIQQKLTAEIHKKEAEIEQLTSQVQVSV